MDTPQLGPGQNERSGVDERMVRVSKRSLGWGGCGCKDIDRDLTRMAMFFIIKLISWKHCRCNCYGLKPVARYETYSTSVVWAMDEGFIDQMSSLA